MNSNRISILFPVALVFYEIAVYLSNDMYLPSLPGLEEDFHVSQELTQYTLLTWFLGSASMQLIMGPLADRFGRRAVLLSGGIFYILTCCVCAMTQDIYVMLAARLIQGMAVCSVAVAGYAAIHELYDSKMAIKVITIMGSVTVLAPAFGPLFGAMMIEYTHWRAIFWFLAISATLGILMLTKVMPETSKEPIRINFSNIAADYYAISLRATFLKFMLPFSLSYMVLICWLVESPFIIIENYQKSTLTFGIIQLWVFGAFMVGAQVTTLIVSRVSALTIINLGLIVSLVGAIMLWFSSTFGGGNFDWIVFSMIITAFGSALAFGPLNRSAIEACHEPMGTRMAVFFTIMNIFGVAGTFLVALFIKTMQSLSCIIFVLSVLALLIFHFADKHSAKVCPN